MKATDRSDIKRLQSLESDNFATNIYPCATKLKALSNSQNRDKSALYRPI